MNVNKPGTEPYDEDRLAEARAEAAWILGDPCWADLIIDIYTGRESACEDAKEAWAESNASIRE